MFGHFTTLCMKGLIYFSANVLLKKWKCVNLHVTCYNVVKNGGISIGCYDVCDCFLSFNEILRPLVVSWIC